MFSGCYQGTPGAVGVRRVEGQHLATRKCSRHPVWECGGSQHQHWHLPGVGDGETLILGWNSSTWMGPWLGRAGQGCESIPRGWHGVQCPGRLDRDCQANGAFGTHTGHLSILRYLLMEKTFNLFSVCWCSKGFWNSVGNTGQSLLVLATLWCYPCHVLPVSVLSSPTPLLESICKGSWPRSTWSWFLTLCCLVKIDVPLKESFSHCCYSTGLDLSWTYPSSSQEYLLKSHFCVLKQE